jgi:hypothetical protein
MQWYWVIIVILMCVSVWFSFLCWMSVNAHEALAEVRAISQAKQVVHQNPWLVAEKTELQKGNKSYLSLILRGASGQEIILTTSTGSDLYGRYRIYQRNDYINFSTLETPETILDFYDKESESYQGFLLPSITKESSTSKI